LVEDDLLGQRQAPAAVLLRPRDARPPGAAQRALPRQPLAEQRVRVTRPAAPAHDGELPLELLGEPGPGLLAEGLVLGGEPQIHACELLVGGGPNLPSGLPTARSADDDHPGETTMPDFKSADELKAAIGK